MHNSDLIRKMSAEYADYLFDESRTMGSADFIAFPANEAELAEVIRRCAEESARYERELWEKRNREARDKVVREGAAVIVLDEEQKEAFRRATESLYEKYCGTQTELVEKIRTLE